MIEETGSDRAALVWDASVVLAPVALIVVEGRSALAAARRNVRLSAAQHRTAKGAFGALTDGLAIVEASGDLIALAANLAEQETLRGYGAVHFATALTVEATVLTNAEADLCEAAQRLGLHVANPLDP